MDLTAGIDFVQNWIDLSYELHSASAEWSSALAARVTDELAPVFLAADDWTGDAPSIVPMTALFELCEACRHKQDEYEGDG
jgi:hypothetical protein